MPGLFRFINPHLKLPYKSVRRPEGDIFYYFPRAIVKNIICKAEGARTVRFM